MRIPTFQETKTYLFDLVSQVKLSISSKVESIVLRIFSGIDVMFLTPLDSLLGRVTPKKEAVLEKNPQLEELMKSWYKRNDVFLFLNNGLNDKFFECSQNFNRNDVNNAPVHHVLQYVSIVSKLGNSNHHADKVPSYAKDYLLIIDSESSIETKISEIKKRFWHKKISQAAIAYLINSSEQNILELIDKKILSFDEIIELSPYLRNIKIDFSSYQKNNYEINREVCNIINACSKNLYAINIKNDYNGLVLPQELPECIIFESVYSNSLNLPNLPKCKSLFIFRNTKITSLLPLPNCIVCNVHSCHLLTTVPSLPLAVSVTFKYCSSLRALPTLSRCFYLDCERTNIEIMPELPFNANVSGQSNVFKKLEVDLDQLEQNPKSFLLKLGEDFLLKDFPFPNIYYFQNGELSIAIDIGGVRRDFLSRIFKFIFKLEPSENHLFAYQRDTGLMPAGQDNIESEKAYRTIGRILTLCYLNVADFKLGEIFDPVLYKLIKIMGRADLSQEEISLRCILALKNLPESIFQLTKDEAPEMKAISSSAEELDMLLYCAAQLLDLEEMQVDFTKLETRKKLRADILALAQEDKRLKALSYIVSEMKVALKEHSSDFFNNDVKIIETKIQGELSAELLKEKLNWNVQGKEPTNEQERLAKAEMEAKTLIIKGYLENWIDRMDKPKLSEFVLAVSSIPTLGSRKIEVDVYNRDADLLPVAHTCLFNLELTANCPDQATFDAKLELFIKESLTGFSLI